MPATAKGPDSDGYGNDRRAATALDCGHPPQLLAITLVAAALGLATAVVDPTVISWPHAAATMLGAMLVHAAANLGNEFPGHGARNARKNTRVVPVGPSAARWAYLSFVATGYAWLGMTTVTAGLPAGARLGLLALPLSLDASLKVLVPRRYAD